MQCVFHEAVLPAGDWTICCSPGWASGVWFSSGDNSPVGKLREDYLEGGVKGEDPQRDLESEQTDAEKKACSERNPPVYYPKLKTCTKEERKELGAEERCKCYGPTDDKPGAVRALRLPARLSIAGRHGS